MLIPISRRKSIYSICRTNLRFRISIEAAMQKIKAAMAKVYSTIGSGQSQVTVSLSRIRTIRGLSSVVNNLGITPYRHWQQFITLCF
jgi:hypothetical protein